MEFTQQLESLLSNLGFAFPNFIRNLNKDGSCGVFQNLNIRYTPQYIGYQFN